MKQTILIIGILMGLLLVSGCAQQGDVTEEDTIVDSIPDENLGDTSENEAISNESENITISQEDLNKLKEELEGLEFEDLGGLSE